MRQGTEQQIANTCLEFCFRDIHTVFVMQLKVNKIDHDWIQTADLWCQKRLLKQLRHNHCSIALKFKVTNVSQAEVCLAFALIPHSFLSLICLFMLYSFLSTSLPFSLSLSPRLSRFFAEQPTAQAGFEIFQVAVFWSTLDG